MALKGISLLLASAVALLCAAEAPAQDELASPKSDPSLDSGPFPPDVKKIKERGKLVVGQYCGERPMFFAELPEDAAAKLPEETTFRMPDGRMLGGVDIAVAKTMARMLGVGLEVKRDYKSFGDVILAVAAKEVDLGVSKLNPTAKRMRIVAFSSPYASFSLSILANRQYLLGCDMPSLEAQNAKMDAFLAAFDKPGTRVAAQRNSATADFASIIFPKAKLLLFDHHEEAVLAVKTGDADAAINDDFQFLFVMLFDPALDIYCKLLSLPEKRYDICMALNPDSLNLMGMANSVADSCRSKVGSASGFLNANRIVLKKIMDAKEASIPPAERKYPFDDSPDEKTQAAGRQAIAVLSPIAAGLPLALFITVWLGMSKRRKEDSDGRA